MKYSRIWFLPFWLPIVLKQNHIHPLSSSFLALRWPSLFAKGQSCRRGSGPEAPHFVIANAAPNQRCHDLTAMKIGGPELAVPLIAGDIFEAKFIGLEDGSDSPSHQTPPVSDHQSEARCHHAHRRPSARSWPAHVGQVGQAKVIGIHTTVAGQSSLNAGKLCQMPSQ